MRIAVDVRPLAAPLTGIGRYTHSLLKHLIDSDHEWFLYSDRPLKIELPRKSNVTLRHGTSHGGTPGSLRWAQWKYVRWANQDDIELFWSPRHHLPLLLPVHIKQVVTIHDMVWRRYPETMMWKNLWLERLLMGSAIRSADRVICVSHFTASEVAEFYPSEMSKLTVVHEAATETSERDTPTDTPQKIILFVGTLEPRKNLPRLLRAYKRLVKTSDTPKLVIVGGGGWGADNLADQISALGLSDHVQLRGYLSDQQLNALYASATCVIVPSLYEGFGLPVVEAMSHGVPVIASNTSSLPEVVGDAGLLIDPHSETEIADAITLLVTDHDLHAELSARARARNTEFSWQKAARETLTIFEQVVA
jgi:glycosyltransferase involved in cell wall biosynthesis